MQNIDYLLTHGAIELKPEQQESTLFSSMLPRLEEVFSVVTKLTLPETVTAPMGPIIEGSNGNLEFGQVFRNNPFLLRLQVPDG